MFCHLERKGLGQRPRSGSQGSVIVEAAIFLPFLLLFLMGVMEVGVLLHNKAVITNASREGARYAISVTGGGTPTDTEVSQWVSEYVANRLVNFSAASVSTTVSRAGTTPGSSVVVRVSYPYTFLVLPNLIESTLSSSLVLRARTTMRME